MRRSKNVPIRNQPTVIPSTDVMPSITGRTQTVALCSLVIDVSQSILPIQDQMTTHLMRVRDEIRNDVVANLADHLSPGFATSITPVTTGPLAGFERLMSQKKVPLADVRPFVDMVLPTPGDIERIARTVAREQGIDESPKPERQSSCRPRAGGRGGARCRSQGGIRGMVVQSLQELHRHRGEVQGEVHARTARFRRLRLSAGSQQSVPIPPQQRRGD